MALDRLEPGFFDSHHILAWGEIDDEGLFLIRLRYSVRVPAGRPRYGYRCLGDWQPGRVRE